MAVVVAVLQVIVAFPVSLTTLVAAVRVAGGMALPTVLVMQQMVLTIEVVAVAVQVLHLPE
jgi:hypothetical protein